MIGDADIDSQHRSERSQQAFGLTQRLMEHQAKREAGLDGDRRIDWLTAPLCGSRSMPDLSGFFGQPNGDAPRRTNVDSGQFATRCRAFGILWGGLIELVGHGSSK